MSVEATDLDLHATIHVDEIEGAGTWSLCIPARFLAAVASAAGTGWVHIEPAQVETKNEKTGATSIRHSAEIRVGVASYTVEAHAPEDYPTIAGEKAGMVERFTNGHFALALKSVRLHLHRGDTLLLEWRQLGVHAQRQTHGRHRRPPLGAVQVRSE